MSLSFDYNLPLTCCCAFCEAWRKHQNKTRKESVIVRIWHIVTGDGIKILERLTMRNFKEV